MHERAKLFFLKSATHAARETSDRCLGVSTLVNGRNPAKWNCQTAATPRQHKSERCQETDSIQTYNPKTATRLYQIAAWWKSSTCFGIYEVVTRISAA